MTKPVPGQLMWRLTILNANSEALNDVNALVQDSLQLGKYKNHPNWEK